MAFRARFLFRAAAAAPGTTTLPIVMVRVAKTGCDGARRPERNAGMTFVRERREHLDGLTHLFSWNLFGNLFRFPLHVLLTSVFGRYAVRSSSLGAAGLGGTAPSESRG